MRDNLFLYFDFFIATVLRHCQPPGLRSQSCLQPWMTVIGELVARKSVFLLPGMPALRSWIHSVCTVHLGNIAANEYIVNL